MIEVTLGFHCFEQRTGVNESALKFTVKAIGFRTTYISLVPRSTLTPPEQNTNEKVSEQLLVECKRRL